MFYGQHREDEFLDSLFPKEHIGVCIEIGADDGISGSNTYFFEKKGWRALCIEPIQTSYEHCRSCRKECVNCCISNENSEKDFHVFYMNTNSSAISGLVPDERLIQSHRHLITDRTSCKTKVRSLTSLLDELNYPTTIDFVSIDTESTELDVLKGIDFDKYDIRVMVIENNFNEPMCEDFLKQYGYKKIHRIAVNDFFVKG